MQFRANPEEVAVFNRKFPPNFITLLKEKLHVKLKSLLIQISFFSVVTN